MEHDDPRDNMDDGLEAPAAEETPDYSDEEPTGPAEDQTPTENDPPKRGKLAEANDADIDAVVEALLFAGEAPIPPSRIGAVAELTPANVRKSIARLNEKYQAMHCSFRVEEIAGGYQMLTLPEYHDVLRRLYDVKKEARLSQAALETLAIVAYRQPILRADIEAIRGVASGEMLRNLMERGLAKIVGRAEVIGRPMLYGTTRKFLEVFGLASLDDLPRVEELREMGRQSKPDSDKNSDEESPAPDEETAQETADADQDSADRQDDSAAQPPRPADEEDDFPEDDEEDEYDDDEDWDEEEED